MARSRVQVVGFGIHALAGKASLDGSVAGLKGLSILIIVPRKFFLTENATQRLKCASKMQGLPGEPVGGSVTCKMPVARV